MCIELQLIDHFSLVVGLELKFGDVRSTIEKIWFNQTWLENGAPRGGDWTLTTNTGHCINVPDTSVLYAVYEMENS